MGCQGEVMNEINFLEEDLCRPVKEYFLSEGYKVLCEVNYCDIVGEKNDELIVVELKKNLSVELLSQAVKRQKFADAVYIAVPKPKRMMATSKWKDLCHLLRRLELGLILVSFKEETSFIEVPIQPVPFQREKSVNMNKKKRTSIIKEINGRHIDMNVGGSKGKKLVTAYRESSIYIACCILKFGPLSPKKLKELGCDSKKTASILAKNFYGWFERIDRGVYDISNQCREELDSYKALKEYFMRADLNC